MGYTFEFYNKSGNITRKGNIPNIKTFIASAEDEYEYVIRKDYYPFEITKQGFFGKSIQSNTANKNNLMAIKKNEIDVFIPQDKVEVYYINNQVAEFKQKGSVVTVQNIPGKHLVLDINQSVLAEFYITDLFSEESLNNLSFDSNTEYLVQSASINEKSSIEYLLDSIKKENKKEDLMSYYDMTSRFFYQYNHLMRANTKTSWGIENISLKIIANNEIDKVIIYKLDGDNKVFSETMHLKNNDCLVLEEHSAYLIEGYKKNQFVSTRIALATPLKIRTALWQTEEENNDRMNYLIEKGRILKSDIPSEVEEDNIIINAAGIYIKRYGSPEISKEVDHIQITIKDIEQAESYNEELFLCGSRRSEFLQKRHWLKIAAAENLHIDYFENSIDEEETYFFWLENSNGEFVSDISVLFSGDRHEECSSLLLDYYVTKEKEQVIERVHRAGQGVFEKMIEDFYYLNEEMSNKHLRLEKLIQRVYEENSWSSVLPVIQASYDQINKDYLVIPNYFYKPLTLSRWTRRLKIPMNERISAAIVYVFDDYSKRMTKKVMINPTHIDLEESYSIVQFVDLADKVVSPYIFLSGRNKEGPIQANRGLEIEVID